MALLVGLGDVRFESATWLLIPHVSKSQKKCRKFIFVVASVAELGTEIASKKEHLCWPGKVTKVMQRKVYFCILHPLCKVYLRKLK